MSLLFLEKILFHKKSLPEKYNKKKIRTCKETSGYAHQKGVLTVEAAIIIPLISCCFALLLYYFQIMQIQLYVQDALENTGRRMAVYAHAMENGREAEETEYRILAGALFRTQIKEKNKIKRFVSGGMSGISLLESEYAGNTISLKAVYEMKFPIRLLGRKNFIISQQTKYRKWTGWNGVKDDSEGNIWVYMAQYGEVYHQTSECTYLKLTIRSVNEADVINMRNDSGSKFRKCGLCKSTVNQFQKVYITNYGDRYHRDLNCSGIKRTIEMKKLSEVEEFKACSKCWSWKKQ